MQALIKSLILNQDLLILISRFTTLNFEARFIMIILEAKLTMIDIEAKEKTKRLAA